MAERKVGFLRLEKGRVEGFETTREIGLQSDVTVIGRPSTDIESDPQGTSVHVSDDYISRGHMRVTYDPIDLCYLAEERDGGTRNGTYINGDRIEPGKRYRLKDGDLIGLAKVGEEFRVMFRFRETHATLAAIPISSLIPTTNLTVDLQARTVSAGDRIISAAAEGVRPSGFSL